VTISGLSPRTTDDPATAHALHVLAALLLLGSVALLGKPAQAAPRPERALASAEEAARPSVERVSVSARTDRSGYVVRVHLTGPVGAYGQPRVEDGAIRWKLYNTDASGRVRASSAPGPLARYMAKAQGDHLLLRFELADGAEVNVSAYRDRATDDLLMNVSSPGSGPPARVASSSSRGAADLKDATDDPGAPAEDDEAPAASASPASRAPDAPGERFRFDTVVIDAGHGGKDPGAQAYGLNEKDVVLGIAKKLGGYIEERLAGVDVVYTRSTDEFMTLRNRGHIANREGGDLFISIHANAAGNRAAHGTETYFMGMSKSDAARQVMERENSVIQMEDNPDQYTNPTSGAMESLMQMSYMRDSERLAGRIQQQFETRADRKNRGVKQARFLVLWAASMPRVLVETGFLTNRSEARFLGSDRGQDLIASSIFRAVRAFKKKYDEDLGLASE
jgi:N-acetylmuramoyl-L-alanine amidase